MNNNLENWEKFKGVEFLKKGGIKASHRVLDFGARVGHYTIPAAFAVGRKGKVFALDKDSEALKEVEKKARQFRLKNIEIVEGDDVRLDFEEKSLDVILLYDVLHFFDSGQRSQLYRQCRRILDDGGIMSIYPKHTVEEDGKMEFENVRLSDIIEEIIQAGFELAGKNCGMLSHDENLEYGCVINFRK